MLVGIPPAEPSQFHSDFFKQTQPKASVINGIGHGVFFLNSTAYRQPTLGLIRCLTKDTPTCYDGPNMSVEHREFMDQMAEFQDKFVWESPMYERHERGPRWYAVVSLLALLLVGYAVWTANFLFAFIILLAAIILVLAGNEHPDTILIQIGDNGIVVDGDFHPFTKLDNFSIVYQPPHVRVLYVESKNPLRPRYRLLLGDQDPVEIRNHLRRYLRENLDLHDEHASDILGKLFKI